MSYSVIPTTNTTGVRRLQALGGIYGSWGLGSVPDMDTLAELQAGGWDPARLAILVQLNATNEQLLALPNPASDDEMTAAYNDLALKLSNAPAATQSTPPTAEPAPGSNFLKAGSQLTYTATWGRFSIGPNAGIWNNPNWIQSQVQSVLSQQWGIVIDSQFHTSNDLINTSGESGFTLQVHTTRDYGTAADVKGIIDGALYQLGVALKSSVISLYVTGVTPVATGAAPGATSSSSATAFRQTPVDWGTWLQQNVGTLVLGLAAVVVLPKLIRKL